jgi:hypothetical protein
VLTNLVRWQFGGGWHNSVGDSPSEGRDGGRGHCALCQVAGHPPPVAFFVSLMCVSRVCVCRIVVSDGRGNGNDGDDESI